MKRFEIHCKFIDGEKFEDFLNTIEEVEQVYEKQKEKGREFYISIFDKQTQKSYNWDGFLNEFLNKKKTVYFFYCGYDIPGFVLQARKDVSAPWRIWKQSDWYTSEDEALDVLYSNSYGADEYSPVLTGIV